jgi:hypothetical protein
MFFSNTDLDCMVGAIVGFVLNRIWSEIKHVLRRVLYLHMFSARGGRFNPGKLLH